MHLILKIEEVTEDQKQERRSLNLKKRERFINAPDLIRWCYEFKYQVKY